MENCEALIKQKVGGEEGEEEEKTRGMKVKRRVRRVMGRKKRMVTRIMRRRRRKDR